MMKAYIGKYTQSWGNKKIKAIIQLQEQFDSKKTSSLKTNQER